jgi:hypothetical protein
MLAVVFSGPAGAEIYTCTDADGSAIYAQTPCSSAPPAGDTIVAGEAPSDSQNLANADADVRSSDSADSITTSSDVISPREQTLEPGPISTTEQNTAARSSNEVLSCKKPLRDQIDAIDAQMRSGYSPEQSKVYQQELRVLTQALRNCE